MFIVSDSMPFVLVYSYNHVVNFLYIDEFLFPELFYKYDDNNFSDYDLYAFSKFCKSVFNFFMELLSIFCKLVFE